MSKIEKFEKENVSIQFPNYIPTQDEKKVYYNNRFFFVNTLYRTKL